MKVRIAGLALCLVASSLLISSPAGAVSGYGDVAGDRFFANAVQWSVDQNITGISGTCFLPDSNAPRGEMAVWTWSMEGQPTAVRAHPFTDVEGEKHNAAISWMLEEMITTGTSPTTFSPERTLTRGEFAVFLHRLEGEPEAPAHSFGDVTRGWQQAAISWLASSGITTGTSPTTFSPENTLNRGQLITFLYRYQDEPSVTVSSTSPTCDPTADGSALSAVSAGALHVCSSTATSGIVCQGENDSGQRAEQTGSFTQVSAGGLHSCAVRTNGAVVCWGSDEDGQTDAPTTGTFRAVSAGSSHSCGLRTNNRLTCWGDNESGQRSAPSGNFKAVSAGGDHSCAIATDDTISCWGSDESGQTDAPSGTFQAVSAGEEHTCAIASDGSVSCWGENEAGQTDAPTGTFQQISAGGNHSCALGTDNTVSCWGADVLSDAPDGTFQSVSASVAYSCGVTSDNALSCWGPLATLFG